MATLASPIFDRYFGRPPLPPGSVPDNTPVDPQRVGIIWYLPRQEMPAASSAVSSAARQAAPAAMPRTEASARPPTTPPPTRPTSQQPISPEPPRQPGQRARAPKPPRRRKELDWLTCQLPAALRQQTAISLRETLRWRARECGPLPPPPSPVERSRFGLRGEQLVPHADRIVCGLLVAELRESVRTMETRLSWSERNYRLVMHSARLGQLCAALEQRGSIDVLEVIRAGLEPLWN
jgi:hypothetical protein